VSCFLPRLWEARQRKTEACLAFAYIPECMKKVFSLSLYSHLGEEKDNRADSGPVQVEAIFK